MDHRPMAPSTVRASRISLLVALTLLPMAGCKHHQRTVMRPAFTTSPGVIVPGGCPSGTPGCSSGPGVSGGTITTEPDSSEPFLTPAPPATGSTRTDPGVRRSGGTSAVPGEATEPPLNVPDAGPSPSGSSLNAPGPELVRPSSASRSTGRRASSPRREPRVSLRDAVAPYLANADDLFGPPKADRPWRYVVLHHSANASGGYDQIDRDHRKILGFDGCGYHFVIGNGTDSPDGRIEVAGRWLDQKQGVHCRNGKTPDVNEYGIGICLVGNFDQSEPTPRQVAAARALVAYLGDRYAIAADHLGTHDQFADGPTACPGKNFPTDAILGPKHLASR